MDDERRARLLGGVLSGVVAAQVGRRPDATPAPMGRGVALVDGDVAWVLVDDRHDASLGPAIAWALRHQARRLVLVTSGPTGVLARRARHWQGELPVEVWRLEGTEPVRAEPDAPLAVVDPLGEHLELAPLIAEAGAEVLVEHGIVTGEVAGLEVCRVVTDPRTEVVRVEVGVGAHDREAFGLLHGDIPVAEALADVVRTVAGHRDPTAPPHPLNRLARERLVRSLIIDRPERIGLGDLVAAAPPVLRTSLKDPVPCVAVGHDSVGAPVVVVCSAGIDLDVVPFGADARELHDPTARLVIVVEERDDHPLQRRLAASLDPAAEIRTIASAR